MPAPVEVVPDVRRVQDVVKELMLTVTNMGKVYTRARGPKFYDDLIRTSVKNGQLNVWEIVVASIGTQIPVEGGGGNIPLRERTYSFQVTGRLAYRDSDDENGYNNSSDQFLAMVEGVENVILTNPFLSGTTLKPVIRVDCDPMGFQMYGSVFVHYVEMYFTTRMRKTEYVGN